MNIPNQAGHLAPGGPGIAARWTSSAKVGVGTALSNDSRVWFTLSHGIFNEIYYPRIDQACVRDMGLIPGDLTDISLAVLRTHESKVVPGGLIASLSIPWGFSKGDNDLGGYHLVWPRDMVETAGGLLAAGAHEDARRVLRYLEATQQPDGHWSQNMWLDGSPYWNGIQMDETALPILLMDLARREKALSPADVIRFWPMVRQAAGYLVRNGPVSPQDRWEEDRGYSPFTVGVQIAALLAAADLADFCNEASIAGYLRETADVWYSCIDRWMYASDTAWCERFAVSGYYVRIAPTDVGTPLRQEIVRIKNVVAAEDTREASHVVSPDALALVRFGVRAADDPRIRDTVTVIDALLKVETPSGTTWHRYNDDGYGEHEDGAPFDGTGIGRGWPLLTGERAHYELAAGHIHWSGDDWRSVQDLSSHDPGLGVHIADLPTQALAEGARISFTFHWLEAGRWEGADFLVLVGES